MQTSKQQFQNQIKTEFGSKLGGPQSQTMMRDMAKYSSEMRESEKLKGGKGDKLSLNKIAEKHNSPLIDIAKQFVKGFTVELEHTKDKTKASEIVMDHLTEDPNYYTKLSKVETKEEKVSAKQQFAADLQKDKDFEDFKKNAKYTKGGAEFTFGTPNVSKEDPYIKKNTKYGRPGRGKEETKEATTSGSSGAFSAPFAFKDSDFVKKSFAETPGLKKESVEKVEATEATTSGSVGGYETPAMWAKSTKKKDWGPSRKTQYKGGAFVKVKKKCTKFPYCNQGDINALKISKNESVRNAINNVAKKYNISEDVIETILEFEYSKTKQ